METDNLKEYLLLEEKLIESESDEEQDKYETLLENLWFELDDEEISFLESRDFYK